MFHDKRDGSIHTETSSVPSAVNRPSSLTIKARPESCISTRRIVPPKSTTAVCRCCTRPTFW